MHGVQACLAPKFFKDQLWLEKRSNLTEVRWKKCVHMINIKFSHLSNESRIISCYIVNCEYWGFSASSKLFNMCIFILLFLSYAFEFLFCTTWTCSPQTTVSFQTTSNPLYVQICPELPYSSRIFFSTQLTWCFNMGHFK